ncbi:MAG: enoyl-CoA hydratase family protein [Deltaproteobacteria bacterium]|nr:enoyl-CoA hydratase family protein [Deltaproteobacteria bacterium]
MTYDSFDYALDDGVATVRLNNPAQLNALTFRTYEELAALTGSLADDPRVHVLVLTGAGKGFCSGGSVDDIIGELLKLDGAGLYRFTRLTCDVVRNMRRLEKPIIAAVNGVAAGAGAALALASDFRLLSDRASLSFLFVKVGLAGSDMGAIHLLPRIVGLGRAMELLSLGDRVDAAEAYRIGLANRVVPHDDLIPEARRLAQRLQEGPRYAIGVTKKLLDLEAGMSLDAALEMEAMTQAHCMQTADFHEGFRAFMARETPRFNQGGED